MESYPYLWAAEDRSRRKRAALIWLGIAAGLALVVGAVLLMTRGSSNRGSAADVSSSPAPATRAAPTTSTPPTTSSGAAFAAASTTSTTTLPPAPAATITAAPASVECNPGAVETAGLVSWTTTDAATVIVTGPGGQLSTLREGNREVLPSRSCEEAPFEDVYTITVHNPSGAATTEAVIAWASTTILESAPE